MLYKTMFGDYDFTAWCCNHIWLHKQPLFLWQIALSLKLFGVSTFILRLPSIIMGSLMILLVYKITDILSNNKSIAFIASFIMCFSYYQFNLISGRKGMDHNDIAFTFYILCSIWALFEYLKSDKKTCWIFVIDNFSGCAILNKWLKGLLVFAPWGILVLKELITTKKISSIYHFLLSLFICVLVFAPWQIYTLTHFPKEAKYEMYFNALHLTQVVENHAGNALYYISNFDLYFGNNIFLFIISGILYLIFSKKIKSKFHFILLFCFAFVSIFFSFIVQTKVQSYYYLIVPIGIIYAGIGIYYLLNTIIKNNVLLIVFSILIVFLLAIHFIF